MNSSMPRTWLVTFIDLSALLFAFFVLTYSMSSFDREALQRLVAGAGAGWDAPDGPGLAGLDQTDLSAADLRPAGPVQAGYLVSVLDRDLAAAGRPCGLGVRLHNSHAELRFEPPPAGGDASACSQAFARAAQILARLAARRSEAAILELPNPVDTDFGLALEWTADASRDLAAILGFVPTAVVSLGPRRQGLLRVGPL